MFVSIKHVSEVLFCLINVMLDKEFIYLNLFNMSSRKGDRDAAVAAVTLRYLLWLMIDSVIPNIAVSILCPCISHNILVAAPLYLIVQRSGTHYILARIYAQNYTFASTVYDIRRRPGSVLHTSQPGIGR